jgi:hypothetical protein
VPRFRFKLLRKVQSAPIIVAQIVKIVRVWNLRQLVNDGIDRLDKSKKIHVSPYYETVSRPFALAIEACDVKGADRRAGNLDLRVTNNSRITV